MWHSSPHGLLAQTKQRRFPPAEAAVSQTFGGFGLREEIARLRDAVGAVIAKAPKVGAPGTA
jgi:hypothetical protein